MRRLLIAFFFLLELNALWADGIRPMCMIDPSFMVVQNATNLTDTQKEDTTSISHPGFPLLAVQDIVEADANATNPFEVDDDDDDEEEPEFVFENKADVIRTSSQRSLWGLCENYHRSKNISEPIFGPISINLKHTAT